MSAARTFVLALLFCLPLSMCIADTTVCTQPDNTVPSVPQTGQIVGIANRLNAQTLIQGGVAPLCNDSAAVSASDHLLYVDDQDHPFPDWLKEGANQVNFPKEKKTITVIKEKDPVDGEEYLRYASPDDLSWIVEHHPEKITPFSGARDWGFTLFPDSKTRLQAYKDMLHGSVSLPDKKNGETIVRAFLKNEISPSNPLKDENGDSLWRYYPPAGEEGKKRADAELTRLKAQPTMVTELGNSDKTISYALGSAARYGLCATYTITHAAGCEKALQLLMSKYGPVGDLMALPAIEKVFTDPSYIEGATKAALTIMDRVKQGKLDGNIWDDIVTGYKQSGLNTQNAQDHAWNLLATWAARGPNLDDYGDLKTQESGRLLTALEVISTAAPYLDQLRIEKGLNPYSLPPQVKTSCSYGKTYHFWMAAFLSQQLAKETGDPYGAMTATYLMELGYNFKSKTYGRDPDRVFMVNNFDTRNNSLRIDMTFGAAGAVFGMKSAEGNISKTESVDTAIMDEIRNSKSQPLLNREQADKLSTSVMGVKSYLEFKQIIAPDAALDSLLSETGK